MNINDWMVILPAAVLMVWAVGLVLLDLWIPAGRKGITAVLAAVGVLVSLGLSLTRLDVSAEGFGGMVHSDRFAVYLSAVLLITAFFSIGLAYDYLRRMEMDRGEYYSLILISVSGMMLMTYARHLLVVFLALEILSIPLYILAGFARLQSASQESALKYFLMGAFSSAFVLYGIALIYAGTGSLMFGKIAEQMATGAGYNAALAVAGAVLFLVGFAFKAAIVPFHMWAPDVYQGAPSSVTAFMAVGAKVAGFAALMRFFVSVFPVYTQLLTPVVWGLSALTMVVGNVVALSQSNIKRMMAYSSIAQAGYILMAFVTFGQAGFAEKSVASLLFFLFSYALTTIGAWAVIIAMEKPGMKGLEISDYAGLGRKHPAWGIAMTIFMLSFTGIPLTLGFWGKLYLFGTAIRGGMEWLAVLGLIASIVSAFYYLRIVVTMFMKPGDPELYPGIWVKAITFLMAILVLALSFVPGYFFELAAKAVLTLPGG